MKKFGSLIIMLVVLVMLSACKPGSKLNNQIQVGDTTITIPANYKVNEEETHTNNYSYYAEVKGQAVASIIIQSNEYIGMDGDGDISIFTEDSYANLYEGIGGTLKEFKVSPDYTINGYDAAYYRYEFPDGDGTTIYAEILQLFLNDRIITINSNIKDKEFYVASRCVYEDIKIDVEPIKHTPQPTVEVTHDPEPSINVIDTSTPAPTEPNAEYEWYQVENVIFPIPSEFFLNEEVSTDDMIVFHSDWSYTASIIVYIKDYATYANALSPYSFSPSLDVDYEVNGFDVQSYDGYDIVQNEINYMGDGDFYYDFDTVICFDESMNKTIIIEMCVPTTWYNEASYCSQNIRVE